MKGFLFLNALLGKFTGTTPTQSGDDYTWPCIPHPTATLTSPVFDSQDVSGINPNWIQLKGSLPPGVNVSNQAGNFVGLQLASSDVSTGPWTYWGDSTVTGISCISGTYYYPEANTRTSIQKACLRNLANKRYWRYQVRLRCTSVTDPTCSVANEGDATFKLDEVVTGWGG